MYKNGQISLSDGSTVKAAADKPYVEESLVLSCVEHLRDLAANKERRET